MHVISFFLGQLVLAIRVQCVAKTFKEEVIVLSCTAVVFDIGFSKIESLIVGDLSILVQKMVKANRQLVAPSGIKRDKYLFYSRLRTKPLVVGKTAHPAIRK